MEIKIEELTYIYDKKTPFESSGIKEVTTKLESGKFYSVVGQPGSGKTTLIQHINYLLKLTSGKIIVGDFKIDEKTKLKNVNELRKRVGFVFQFPEDQLFEETVEKEILFAPTNFEIQITSEDMKEALELVGLTEEHLKKSPFKLSGGEMRRVAIASILIYKPDILVLDEPTRGLDPKMQKEIMEIFKKIQTKYKKTIILVTHNMDDVLEYSDEVLVFHRQRLIFQGKPIKLFTDEKVLNIAGLKKPKTIIFAEKLGLDINKCKNMNTLVKEITKWLKI